MRTPISAKINIFISVDQQSLGEYFNAHDPAPIYKRQLSHAFELYIMNSIVAIRRHSTVNYRVCSRHEDDRQYAEPLVYAIRRHFQEKKSVRQAEFEKFKRRSYFLLFFSLAIVMICQGFLPLLFAGGHQISTGLLNTIDIFTWVILWRPIDLLIFCWNPFLKDISIMERLANAEVIVVENA
jgi:hypothetical protein